MINYIIGADGGGTATVVNVCTVEGKLLHEWKFGPLNINGQSYEAAEATLKRITEEVRLTGLCLSHCAGVCIGAAGISNKNTSLLIRKTLQKEGITAPVILAGDHETALAAVAEDMCGVILIAGTGSICFGKDNQGKGVRAGGYGHVIDDAGSAYAIGRDILKAMVYGIDGRGEATVLKKAVFKKLSINEVEELITWLYAPERKKSEIAALAVVLEEAVSEGDKAAEQILETAVWELFMLIKAVMTKLRDSKTLVLGGSVLLNNFKISSRLSELVKQEYPQITIVNMQNHAAYGAVKLIRRELLLDETISHN